MKVIRAVSTTALFLLFAATVPAFAQDDHHDQDAKPEPKTQEAKPAQHEEQAKPAEHQEEAMPEKKAQEAKPAQHEEEAKPAKQEEQAKSEKQQQDKSAEQANATHEQGQQHPQRSAAEVKRQSSAPALRLSARSESRIPDDRFRSNFGRGHEFRIGNPRIVDGYSRFQYGGYWFGFVEPWPAGWYYTDNVYVDFIGGGYYLCNPYYPDARVSISVVL